MKPNLVFILQFVLMVHGLRSQNPTAVWTQTAHPDLLSVNGVAFSQNSDKLISGTDCHPSKIRIYDVSKGTIDWDYTLNNAFYCVMGVNFSSNGKYFAAVEEMGHVLIFNNQQNPPVLTHTVNMGTTYAFSIDFAPNSRKIAVGGDLGKLQTYLLHNGALDLNVSAHNSWITAVNYSHDNTKIVSGGSDTKIKIWDTTGTLLQTLSGHTDDISALKFTKNNQHLISTSLDDKIKLWDVNTGQLLHTIQPQGGDLFGLAVSPDNNYFATVSYDKKIRVYNLTTYELEFVYENAGAGLPRCIAWSPTNLSEIAVGYSGGTVVLFNYTFNVLNTDIKKEDESIITTYPNPFKEDIKINWPQGLLHSIEILDIEGKVLHTYTDLQNQQNLSIENVCANKPGKYLLICTTSSGKQIVKKLIKNQ